RRRAVVPRRPDALRRGQGLRLRPRGAAPRDRGHDGDPDARGALRRRGSGRAPAAEGADRGLEGGGEGGEALGLAEVDAGLDEGGGEAGADAADEAAGADEADGAEEGAQVVGGGGVEVLDAGEVEDRGAGAGAREGVEQALADVEELAVV